MLAAMGAPRVRSVNRRCIVPRMSTPTAIDFWFDFSSPYAYIANEWIDALAARHGRPVRRHAILLGVTFQAAELKSPVSYPLKRDYAWRDFDRSARFAGVPFHRPEPFPLATHLAARVFWWLLETQGEAAATAWTHTAFRAVFTRNVPINDPVALRQLVGEAGWDATQAEAAWNDPHWKDRLRAENDAAIALGVFGAPFFRVDGEPFWGNDRQEQLARWLQTGGF